MIETLILVGVWGNFILQSVWFYQGYAANKKKHLLKHVPSILMGLESKK